jgi:cation:H+ antiporter
MILITLLGGLLLLWLGGETFMRGSIAVARRLNVSHLMIGLTLVGFGTSLPELITSVTAALRGSPGISVGNVVGSNIANVLLVLAIAALIRPVRCRPEAFYRDTVALAAATVVGTALILLGHIGRLHGSILVAGLAGYIVLVYLKDRPRPSAADRVIIGKAGLADSAPDTLFRAAILVIVGLSAVVGGSWLLVSGATKLAVILGVSKTFIGLTIVAVGTSLPELVITAVASLRGRSDVALGNIMGSNMFNTLGILGVTAIVAPIDVPAG